MDSSTSFGAAIRPLSALHRNYAMSVLLSLGIINYLDRNIVQILGESIKHDLRLADWQLGLMSGLAFGVLYTLLGVPIARLAERGHRPYIIATAAGVWSAFTVLCGMAQGFWQLALARVGVGVGEAGCSPPAYSLLMDYSPPEKRSSALAFYGLGPPLGGLLGMAFGGLLADAYGWRTAFLIAGAPGLLLAVLTAITLPEPRRALHRRIEQIKGASASLGETLRHLVAKRSYRFLAGAMTLKVFIAYGYGPFVASFYFRNHADQLADAARSTGSVFGYDVGPVGFLGIALGLMNGVPGALGTWCGGAVADRLGSVNPRFYVIAPSFAAILTIPPFIGAMMVGDLWLSLWLYALHAFVSSIWYGPTWVAVLSVTPSHMRATGSALLLFISNLVGLGLAPLGVGLLSDALGRSLGAGEGLRYALTALTLIGVFTAFFFWMSAKTLVAEAAEEARP